jgi:hypothetical protein
MPEAQKKKTVPFPGVKLGADGLPKDIPTVNMNHPMLPVVEKFLVPAAWFAGGVLISRIFWPRVKHVSFKE